MHIHVVNVPQSCTTKEYSLCGFSQKAINFCWMMKSLGYRVTLYGGEDNEALCDEHVTCVSKEEQKNLCAIQPYIYPSWNPKHPVWVAYNKRVAEGINSRKTPGDLVCVVGGNCHKVLEQLVPDLKIVEYGIGYTGHFAKYKVWESHTWRHFQMGRLYKEMEAPNPKDTVINCFYDHDDYAIGDKKGYALYLGRVTALKGVEMACIAAERAGKRLLVAGYGEKKLVGRGAEYLGAVDHKTKIELLSGAEWLICPTVGIEAYGNVACEAQLSGVPVLSTNWGGFTETVNHGYTGWRCESIGEFVEAFNKPVFLNRRQIRENAIGRWSRHIIKWQYQRYFERLAMM